MITTVRVAGRGAALKRLKALHRRATRLDARRAKVDFLLSNTLDEIRRLEQKLGTTVTPVLEADRLLAVARGLFRNGEAEKAQTPAIRAHELYYAERCPMGMARAQWLLDRIDREVG